MESRQERSGSGVATIEKPRPSINETLRDLVVAQRDEEDKMPAKIYKGSTFE